MSSIDTPQKADAKFFSDDHLLADTDDLEYCPTPWSAEFVIGQFQNINFYANSVLRANVSIYLASDGTRVAEKEDNLKWRKN